MGDAYYQGGTRGEHDAEHFGAGWTRDELILLRDMWRWTSLAELAKRLGRTEAACNAQYYLQIRRPEGEQWQPAKRELRAWAPTAEEKRAQRPVQTIHDDEDRWWEADYYRTQ